MNSSQMCISLDPPKRASTRGNSIIFIFLWISDLCNFVVYLFFEVLIRISRISSKVPLIQRVYEYMWQSGEWSSDKIKIFLSAPRHEIHIFFFKVIYLVLYIFQAI